MYGLWYFGIPTLLEFNQFSSPFFHLVNARLLNAPGTKDLRSYETQSIVNDRIMALLGVRYLISDKLLPERAPVLKPSAGRGARSLCLLGASRQPGRLLGDEVRRATDAQGAIALLADPAIDLAHRGRAHHAGRATAAGAGEPQRLIVERGGYRIEADSPGTSLLVLPVEYSHCLRAT